MFIGWLNLRDINEWWKTDFSLARSSRASSSSVPMARAGRHKASDSA
jgi:hypothetical protein